MTPRTLRRTAGVAIACAAVASLTPAVASASTYRVDDDGAQCPNASFTSIQAAVDQAAPWDTLVVCAGTYEEQSTPASGNGSPSQAGSLNGLTITKPLTIRGAGASKVTIMPKPSLTTLAGTAPYLRDGGGNVVTVSRQARDSTDFNVTFVDISGVTITSGSTTAEAGVAFFNSSGAIRNSVVGPLERASDATELAAAPHGWGVVVSNHFQGADAGPRREVTIRNSLITGYQSGGVLFDDSRGPDGSATTLARSGIVSYGRVIDSQIIGSGPDELIPQTGIQYHAGQRGIVSGSVVSGNHFTPDPRKSVAILATDAQTTEDPNTPGSPGLSVLGNTLSGNGYGIVNATIDNAAVREGAPLVASTGAEADENFFGCAAGPVVGGPSSGSDAGACQGVSGPDSLGAPSVLLGTTRTSAPAAPSAPGATPDADPAGRIAEPLGGTVLPGEPISPVVIASDDFGVKSVSLSIGGSPIAEDTAAPYEFPDAWAAGYDEIGDERELTAKITDSSGQTTTRSVTLRVVAPEDYSPVSVDTTVLDIGAVQVGSSSSGVVTLTNTGVPPITPAPFAITGAGFSVIGGTCAAGTPLAPNSSCTVEVSFAPTAAGAATGTLTIPYAPLGGGEPIVVDLSGFGELPPPKVPVNTVRPSLSGTGVIGSALTCKPGTWSNKPTRYTYRWLRDGTAVRGATKTTYTPVKSDLTSSIRCEVTAYNADGPSVEAFSNARTVTFAATSTSTSISVQAGPAIVTFPKTSKASSNGTVTLATVYVAPAGGALARAYATLSVGGKRYDLSAGKWIGQNATSTLSAKLSSAAFTALKKGSGTMSVRVIVNGLEVSGTASASVKVTR